jgi:hypothetical protein
VLFALFVVFVALFATFVALFAGFELFAGSIFVTASGNTEAILGGLTPKASIVAVNPPKITAINITKGAYARSKSVKYDILYSYGNIL